MCGRDRAVDPGGLERVHVAGDHRRVFLPLDAVRLRRVGHGLTLTCQIPLLAQGGLALLQALRHAPDLPFTILPRYVTDDFGREGGLRQ